MTTLLRRPPVPPRAAARRAGGAFAATGLLALAGAAPAEPPALAAPMPPAAGAEIPAALEAPTPLSEAFGRAARPLSAPESRWHDLSAPEPTEDDLTAEAADDDDAKSPRWISFAPRRVRPVSNHAAFDDLPGAPVPSDGYGANHGLTPQPDPIAGGRVAYQPPAGDYAPVPRYDRAPDYGPSFGAPRYAPPRYGAPAPPVDPPVNMIPPGVRDGEPLPPGVDVRRGMVVRDLRGPQAPPTYPAPPVDHYGSHDAPPPTGAPFGEPYGAGYGGGYRAPIPGGPLGVGAGFGAGPIVDLAAAGGMCDLGACDGGVPLFRGVRVEDPENVHPYAVRKVVAVADPRFEAPPSGLAKLFRRVRRGHDAGPEACAPGCDDGPALVFVEVCVPPCRAEQIKVTRHGHRVHLDYGKYEVTLTSRDGCVKVDYDD